MLTKVLIFAIFAMSLDLVMGFTGLISFGWAAFFGISGYSVGILTTHYGMTSFWVVLPLALLVTAVLAAVIGYLSLRVSGIYFLLVTMAFAQLLVIVATKWYSMTGGRDGLFGIPDPDLGFIADRLDEPELLLLRPDRLRHLLRHPPSHHPLLVRQDPAGRARERAADEEPGVQHVGPQVHGPDHRRGLRRGRRRAVRVRLRDHDAGLLRPRGLGPAHAHGDHGRRGDAVGTQPGGGGHHRR